MTFSYLCIEQHTQNQRIVSVCVVDILVEILLKCLISSVCYQGPRNNLWLCVSSSVERGFFVNIWFATVYLCYRALFNRVALQIFQINEEIVGPFHAKWPSAPHRTFPNFDASYHMSWPLHQIDRYKILLQHWYNFQVTGILFFVLQIDMKNN